MEENKEEVEELTPVEDTPIVSTEEEKVEEKSVEEIKPVEETPVEEVKPEVVEKPKKSKKGLVIVLLILLLVGIGVGVYFLLPSDTKTKNAGSDSKKYNSEFRMSGNGLENFDLQFLKLENNSKHSVYSPLSIKYALEMLSEGASGDTKKQLDAIIGDYESKKYTNNDHMSFANAVFIRNSYKDKIKSDYTKNLADKYNAEVIYDDFNNADNMNNWVSQKTFKMIGNLFDSDKVKDENFILTNALAIDMNWNNQIHCATGSTVPCLGYDVLYRHEKYKNDREYSDSIHPITEETQFYPLNFNGKDNIKSVRIVASFNRYDAVKEIGEDKIREEVGKAYKEWLETSEAKNYLDENYFPKDVNKYLDKYIEELNANYNQAANSTDFSLYTDDDVKVFAKDLKEYDGTTLQYVGIMPIKEDLNKYIENVSADDLNKIIKNLKEMKIENFKDGVVTLVNGHIPFFKYDSTLNLIEDLQKLGVKDVFDINKADLSNMLEKGENQYIADASHKAMIEFSNDGIKAAAATQMGGAGATSGGFNYLYEIPVEEIDLDFNKPYMYLIRDKKTGEVWFTGKVYEPIERSVAFNPDELKWKK